ncbi:MAG TPA: hypothetical protein VF604_02565 [Pyrinomonadaceae bacterium]|jgi:hypothetical protein
MKRKVLWSLLALILFASVNAQAQKKEVMAAANKIVAALKNKDLKTVARFVHPTKGLRIAPYGYLEKSDLVFKKAQVPSLFLLRRTYVWGAFDGSGDPINVGFPEYYKKFIYDRNYVRAPGVSYDKQIGYGNGVFNVRETYPKAKFVGYNFPESKDGDVMGWSTLYLVFEKSGAQWYLLAVVHDEWVI